MSFSSKEAKESKAMLYAESEACLARLDWIGLIEPDALTPGMNAFTYVLPRMHCTYFVVQRPRRQPSSDWVLEIHRNGTMAHSPRKRDSLRKKGKSTDQQSRVEQRRSPSSSVPRVYLSFARVTQIVFFQRQIGAVSQEYSYSYSQGRPSPLSYPIPCHTIPYHTIPCHAMPI